jgi:tetratricopeptide (TPR) repeat protein
MTEKKTPSGDRHLTLEDLAQLLTTGPDEEAQPVLHHLFAVCPTCRDAYERLRELSREVRYWDLTVALAEARQAPELWQRLEQLPYAKKLRAVKTEPAYQTWGLCRLLQHKSAEISCPSPTIAAQLAKLAIALSGELDLSYDEEWVQDLRAVSYAYLGNACRLLGELESAERAFDASRALRDEGTGYPSVEAEALALEALLRRDQHRLDAAVDLLERVHAIHTSSEWHLADPDAADPHRAGEALLQKAWCVYHLGRQEVAQSLLEQAGSLLDAQRQPRLERARRCGLVWCALMLDRLDEAEARLAAACEVVDLRPIEDRLRLRRAQARLEVARGRPEAAFEALAEGVRALPDPAPGFDGMFALIDLAQLDLRMGGPDSTPRVAALLREVAARLMPARDLGEMGQEGRRPLRLLEEAGDAERLTPELLDRLASTLERLRRPSLRWWSGWGTNLAEMPIDETSARLLRIASNPSEPFGLLFTLC